VQIPIVMKKSTLLFKLPILLLVAYILSACTSTGSYNREPAAPTIDSSPSMERGPDKPHNNFPGGVSPAVKRTTSNPAIQSLLKQSRQSRDGGNLPLAISHIERALRIAPRNVDLWLELAGLHLEALNFQNAEQVARKSLSFAQESVAHARTAWYIIATALEATGDKAQATRIRQYARTL